MHARLAPLLAVSLLVAAVPTSLAQVSPDGSSLSLWAHGEVRDGTVPGTYEEVIWINADRADARGTDTANGPGYCPNTPSPGVYTNEAGYPECLAESQARPGGSFDHTFTLAMDPALSDSFELDPDGLVLFEVYLGAASGSCTGSYDATLTADGETVAAAEGVEVDYSSAYGAFVGEAPVESASVPAGAEFVWEIHVTCDGDGMFLGVHDDNGKSAIVLPLFVASEEEDDEEPTGNVTVDPEDNSTAEPTGEDDPEPSGNTTASPTPQPATAPETSGPGEDVDSDADESSGVPGPGLMAVLALLGVAAVVARRR